ncbi:MAG: JDVT-CTERM system glutamic-type intramembrane protease [Marinobacter sp.]|uniref:JDVT-CTERM system glutamic-type intramembrane protease MrtJ n=1 Tax=Marinobacter sp. TaxID=50741 RepID=UPI00397597A7
MPHSGEVSQTSTTWSSIDILRDWQFQAVMSAAIPIGFLWVAWIRPRAGAFDAGVTTLIAFVVVFPLLEEFVFRGMIQRWLLKKAVGKRHYGPITVANLVTTLLFAIAHLPRGGLLLALGVIVPSVCLGYFFERHQRLVSPIMMHMAFNLIVAMSFIAIEHG